MDSAQRRGVAAGKQGGRVQTRRGGEAPARAEVVLEAPGTNADEGVDLSPGRAMGAMALD
jgi:hypothetical protein